ncbi:MBL fold metallo-hydrolase [Clostridium estertheticum]|uniref:MBL fold metallo-hydrolase n=1 Tax=Clostridium estertheticum TaxID=238834 RepID=UPI0013E8F6D5|nr:MBL fold metallo-hydrolase [Clostridium estertheticum]MBZ9685225.1 MBL fold metallo-hydrolase [Clostridium estertheticum]
MDNIKSGLHTVEQIAPNTYRIDENGAVNCYLAVGKDRALLIDTGCGIGNLKSTVEQITALPVDVVLTHAHCDHAGGVGWYERFFVHEADRAFAYRILSSRLAARTIVRKTASKSDFAKLPFKSKPMPISNGHIFELGGRSISVIHTPGHTRGSIVLLDDKHKIMFTGDDINPFLLMCLPGCTSLKEWLTGGEKILEFSKEYTAYYGHGDGVQTVEQMEKTINYIRDILSSKVKNTFFSKNINYTDNNGDIQIVYDSRKVV